VRPRGCGRCSRGECAPPMRLRVLCDDGERCSEITGGRRLNSSGLSRCGRASSFTLAWHMIATEGGQNSNDSSSVSGSVVTQPLERINTAKSNVKCRVAQLRNRAGIAIRDLPLLGHRDLDLIVVKLGRGVTKGGGRDEARHQAPRPSLERTVDDREERHVHPVAYNHLPPPTIYPV